MRIHAFDKQLYKYPYTPWWLKRETCLWSGWGMKKVTKTKLILSAAFLLAASVAANASPFVLTIGQVGSNVVVTGSGEFDLAGLTAEGGTSTVVGGLVNPMLGWVETGPAAGFDFYVGMSGPSSFGGGSFSSASSNSGTTVYLQAFPQEALLVPNGYKSGTALSESSTYDNVTIAGLGLAPGTYKWTWGNLVDQSFTLEIGETNVSTTPIPAALPLLASGLGALGLLGRCRKRKAQAVA
jgi:hypothetical protein